jgi:LuxR family transcriptional regulator, maltose regulon positive regulatory protein
MDIERVIELLRSGIKSLTVVVLDDYHESSSGHMNRLLTALALAAIPDLHLVVLSRNYPEITVEELILKGMCLELSQNSMEFDAMETAELFALNGFPLNSQDQALLYRITDGWTAAVYLALLKYAEDKSLEDITEITRLMKSAVYDKFDRETQQILLALSLPDSFTADGAVYITENKKAGEVVHQIAADNRFIRYDNKNHTYSIHAILKTLLQNIFSVSKQDKAAVLARCGDYCAGQGKWIEAIDFYHQAGSHDKILDIMERSGATEYFDRAPQIIIRAFADMDKERKLSRPLAYLTFIYAFESVDPEEGAGLLYEAKAYYEADRNLIDREQILGEIALAEGILQFNNAPLMSEYQRKAYDLFGGASSRISNASEAFTFGAPHTLYLYHKESSGLLNLVEMIERNVDYYTHISNGCGTGFEHAARAEYSLETGDLKQAELSSYKAIFKARTKNQQCLVVCGSLCLARLSILNGRPGEAAAMLESLRHEIESAGDPTLLNCLEISIGYIYGCLGDLADIPKWLREGDLSNSVLFKQGLGINYIVIGRAAVLRRSYAELEVIVETMREIYGSYNHLFGLIHAGIYSAIAKYHLYGTEVALKELIPATELAEPDGIVTPFAENMRELEPVLREMKKTRNCGWLEKVFQLGERYLNALEILNGRNAAEHLTARENEIIALLEEGLSQREIAEKLYLSHNTVRRHLQNIYEKLGASNKTIALKKAEERRNTYR